MDKKAVYERVARFYDILDFPFEYARYRRFRPLLFAGLGGRILDAGVGTGRNIPFYPEGSEIVGIELSPAMLRRAEARRARCGRAVELLEMDVRRTSFPDDHFDGIVSSFLFCVLDDDQQLPALKELRRICKPEGEIRLLEYAYSEDPVQRFIMRLWAPWVRWAYGAAFDRNTEQYLPAAGLAHEHEKFVYRDVLKLLVLKPES